MMEKWWKSLSELKLVTSKLFEDSDTISHVERSPGSPYGGEEVYDGEEMSMRFSALLTGDLDLYPELIALGVAEGMEKAVEGALYRDIKEYGKDGIIASIKDDIDNLYSYDGKLNDLNIIIKSLTPKSGDIHNITFVLEYETLGVKK